MIRTLLALLVLLAFAAPAVADDGHHGQGHDAWHQQFYQGLLSPETRVSCCSLNDCRPTEGREHAGRYEVMVDGKWVEVLSSKIVKKSAPDGGFHVCAPVRFSGDPKHIYCVIVPPEI